MKKLAIIAMALVLTVCMAACGPRDTTDTTTTPSSIPQSSATTGPTTQTTVPATTEPTNDNGAVGDAIDDITGGGNSATDATGSRGRGRNNAANMQ